MILTRDAIKANLGTGIIIKPFYESQLGPNSYDVRLHNELLIYNEAVLDPMKKLNTVKFKIPEEGLRLIPGTLYLGRTVEFTATPGFVPMLEGRSSVGRLGISVHVTAGVGDVGFQGYWTLEITCVHPVIVYPNMRIAQLIYYYPYGDLSFYSGKYNLNTDIQESLIYEDFIYENSKK